MENQERSWFVDAVGVDDLDGRIFEGHEFTSVSAYDDAERKFFELSRDAFGALKFGAYESEHIEVIMYTVDGCGLYDIEYAANKWMYDESPELFEEV